MYTNNTRRLHITDDAVAIGKNGTTDISTTTTDNVVRVGEGGVGIYNDSNNFASMSSAGMSVIQGHYHTEFNITYTSNPMSLHWSMMVGCLINDDSLAFAYNKINSARVILGCGIIINGQPKLLPMVLKKGGRWNGIVN